MNLKGHVALVTGGARMGFRISELLAQEGCHVVVTWRESKAPAEAVVANVSSLGVKSLALQCDLSDTHSIQSMLAELVKQMGRLDLVINLASIYKKNSLDVEEAASSWKAHLEANAQGAYLLSLAAAPIMKKTGGHLIHISDWTSASGRPRYADYGAYYVSKAALKATVESLALSLAPEILVNAIAPGPILPPPGLTNEESQAVVDATPLKRWGGVDEVARTVLFLAQTEFITGETIRVDGGRHLN